MADGSETAGGRPTDAPSAAQDAPTLPWHSLAEELDAAGVTMRTARIGLVGKAVWPFTRALKEAIKRQFPKETEFYAFADNTWRHIIGAYIQMRLITLTILLAMMGTLYVIAWTFVHSTTAAFTAAGIRPDQFVIGIGGVAALVFFSIRFAVRSVMFSSLVMAAQHFSHKVKDRLRLSQMEVVTACEQIRHRIAGRAWADHARDWMVAALFRAKRTEYLDRYATTVLWQFETTLPWVEWVFWSVNAIAALFVGYQIWTLGSGPASREVHDAMRGLIVILAIASFIWIADRKPNNFWSKAFSGQETDTPQEWQYMVAIPQVVQNLVAEIQDHAMGSRDHR